MLVTVETISGPRKARVCRGCRTVCIPSGDYCSSRCYHAVNGDGPSVEQLEAWVNDARKWEAVTDGEDVFVWDGDDLVHEWNA